MRRPSRALPPPLSRANFDAVVFDLDGVITRTAKVHARAWKRMFDERLARLDGAREPAPFDIVTDYLRHVDGMPRYDGVQNFLAARGIEVPRGDPLDPPTADTVCGLGNRKDELFRDLIEREGAEVYPHAIALVKRLRAAGFRTAVVSSSRNCTQILRSAGAYNLFDIKLDGADAAARGLKGKPAPDVFLAAVAMLGVDPRRAVVVEDALAGVAAGRAGGFGLVIGVDRAGQAAALQAHGADLVVTDLGTLAIAARRNPRQDVQEAGRGAGTARSHASAVERERLR